VLRQCYVVNLRALANCCYYTHGLHANIQISAFSPHSFVINYTSNMAAWFCAQFNGVYEPEVFGVRCQHVTVVMTPSKIRSGHAFWGLGPWNTNSCPGRSRGQMSYIRQREREREMDSARLCCNTNASCYCLY